MDAHSRSNLSLTIFQILVQKQWFGWIRIDAEIFWWICIPDQFAASPALPRPFSRPDNMIRPD